MKNLVPLSPGTREWNILAKPLDRLPAKLAPPVLLPITSWLTTLVLIWAKWSPLNPRLNTPITGALSRFLTRSIEQFPRPVVLTQEHRLLPPPVQRHIRPLLPLARPLPTSAPHLLQAKHPFLILPRSVKLPV